MPRFTTVLAAAVLLVAVTTQAAEIRVGAGAAPTENIFNKVNGAFEKATGIKVTLISNGPAAALKDLDKGAIDLATGGVTFQDWMDMMAKEGSPVADPTIYKHRVIGKDVVKVFVHKSNPVKSLTKEQLKGIFTGQIKNWKDVGGANEPVVVLSGSKIPGTQSVFQKQILDGAAYAANTRPATTADDIKQQILTLPGGIGLGPTSLADATVGVPQIPEVGRPITAITKGAPSPDVLKLLDFIRGDGQQYVSR